MKIITLSLSESNPAVTLTAYLHEEEQEAVAGVDRPAVVVCPGGGYLCCSPREGEPVALRFFSMGYHAFVLRYSVYSDGKDMFPDGGDMPVREHSVYPAALRDLGKAFLTIRSYAKQWRVDAERLAVIGFSAGAHNCAMYSVNWHKPVLTEYFHEPAESFRPAAAILCYGLSDYFLMRDAGAGDPAAAQMHRGSNIAFLGDVEVPDERLLEVSPALHVDAHTPPTFLWATSEDSLVPVENSTRMASALAAAHIPFEIHVFESGMHGLSLADQSTADSLMTTDVDAAQWVPLCTRWLQKRFALPLPKRPVWMDAVQTRN